jgi:CDP-diacylglycerol--glycerol-3-phosphate 3-phosphatidyltransferase
METFREQLQRLVIPVGKLLAKLKIHPNLISISGILFGIISAYFFISHDFLLAVIFFIISGMSDVFDGMVARMRGIESSFGGFFDNFCSAYTDSAVFLGLIIGNLCDPVWGFAALVGMMTRLLTFRLIDAAFPREGKILRTRFPYVLAGKGDRIVLIAIGATWGLIQEAVIVIAIVANLTAILRAHYVYRTQKKV